MNGGRPCKRARIDLNAVPDDDGGINLSSMLKLTPGKHVINVSCSKVGNNLDELVSSSNQRMHALFGDDQNINVRRFAQGFGFGDSSDSFVKSCIRESCSVECGSVKNSKSLHVFGSVANDFGLNSISGNNQKLLNFLVLPFAVVDHRKNLMKCDKALCKLQEEDNIEVDNMEVKGRLAYIGCNHMICKKDVDKVVDSCFGYYQMM